MKGEIVWMVIGIVLWWLGAVGTYSIVSRRLGYWNAARMSAIWFISIPMTIVNWSIIKAGNAILDFLERRRR